jgi:sugar transferase (PEP-CTERM/EpsH1 system associated)
MRKIKILHILYSFGIGGMEKGIAMLINHGSMEFEHQILCLTESGDSKYLIPPNIPIFEMHKPPGNSVTFIFRLAKKIREIQPDIVHTRNFGGMDGIIASRLAGVKAVVHGEHGWGMDDPDGQNPKRKFSRRWLSLFVSEFTAVSKQIQSWLSDDINVFRIVSQVYNGVVLKPSEKIQEKQCLRRELNIPETALLIGTVGRLDPIKDQAGLIDAFGQFKKSFPELHLIIVGEGDERSTLETKAFDSVHLLGMRKDVADILQSIDVFVLPSLNEGISNTILEAMAAGLPIVATAVGGTPELIQPNENGILVEARDYPSLTAAMARYASDEKLRMEHGANNLAIIKKQFSVEAMVAGYEFVWQRVFNNSGL